MEASFLYFLIYQAHRSIAAVYNVPFSSFLKDFSYNWSFEKNSNIPVKYEVISCVERTWQVQVPNLKPQTFHSRSSWQSLLEIVCERKQSFFWRTRYLRWSKSLDK